MNLPRGRPRDQHADAKILKATIRLLEQHGFRAVTLEGIAEEAGVARTTVYRRWPNKAAGLIEAFLLHYSSPNALPGQPLPDGSILTPMQILPQAIWQKSSPLHL